MDLKRLKDNPSIVLFAVTLVLAAIVVLMCTSGVFGTGAQKVDKTDTALVNINTADEEELAKLDGISDVLAQRIVEYRNENGEFSSVEQIKEVYGIGDGIYKRVKNYVTTE